MDWLQSLVYKYFWWLEFKLDDAGEEAEAPQREEVAEEPAQQPLPQVVPIRIPARPPSGRKNKTSEQGELVDTQDDDLIMS